MSTPSVLDLKRARIPLASITRDPDTLPCKEQASVRAFMRKWIKRPRDLMISGDSLSGKTWVAGRLATELVLAGNIDSVRYTTMAEMIANVLEHDGSYLDYVEGISHLFIDNINAEKNAYAPSLLGKVYRQRKDYELVTVLVTSLDAEAFKTIYTEELYSQLSLICSLQLMASEEALEKIRHEEAKHYVEEA